MDKKRAFGEELAGRRSEKGVSLEEMARVTKVRKPILEALESGRLEDLPPEVFTIGFLKVYANYLGINPTVVVSQYKRLTEPPVPAQQEPRPAFESVSWFRIAGIAVALAVVVGVAAWLWWSYQEGQWPFALHQAEGAAAPETPAAEPQPAAGGPRPPEESGAFPAGEAQTPGGTELVPDPLTVPPSSSPTPGAAAPPDLPKDTTGTPAPVPAVPSAQMPAPLPPQGDLVLTCTQSCWLEMWADGKRVVYRQVTPGERLAFNGQRFRFTIGNTSGLQLTWHGQSVALPQENGRVLKDFILPPKAEGAPTP